MYEEYGLMQGAAQEDHDGLAAVRALTSAPFRLLIDVIDDVRDETDVQDVVGGVSLERVEPAALRAGSLEAVFAAIDKHEAVERIAARRAGAAIDELVALPHPLRDLAFERAGERGWVAAGPGMRVMDLLEVDGAKAQLIRIEPGCGVPTHTHAGREATFVLRGAFSDGRRTYRRGDLCFADEDVTHRPLAKEEGVCMALAVTEGGLRFKGALGVLQRIGRLN